MQCASGAASVAMQELAGQHRDGISHLELLENPVGCRAAKAINKGALTLVCCSTKVATAEPKGNHMAMHVEYQGHTIHLWVQQSTVSPLDSCKQLVDHPFVSPFWFVPEASDGTPSNMTLKLQQVTVGQYICFVPVLVNDKRLGKEDKLLYKIAEPLSKKLKD